MEIFGEGKLLKKFPQPPFKTLKLRGFLGQNG